MCLRHTMNIITPDEAEVMWSRRSDRWFSHHHKSSPNATEVKTNKILFYYRETP